MYKERLLTKILLPIFSVILVIVIQLASFLGSAVIIVSNPRSNSDELDEISIKTVIIDENEELV